MTLMKSRKDRVNQIHFTAADHLQDLCMYIKRGMTEYADMTLARLRIDIDALEEIKIQELQEQVKAQPPPRTQMFGDTEKIECYYCQLEEAGYKNLSDSKYPYICDGCWRWEISDKDQEGYKPL